MFSHLCLIFLSWLLSLVAIGLAFADAVSINSSHDVSNPRTQMLTGTRGSFTATVGSWNHSASTLGASETSNCACDQETASGSGKLAFCTLCVSAAPVAPESSRSFIGLTITGSRQSQLSTLGPYFSISSRSNSSFESRTGSSYRYSTATSPFPTAPGNNSASRISDETRQAVSTGFTPSSPTFRRNSSSNVSGNTLGRLPTTVPPSPLIQHANKTSTRFQGVQPLLSSLAPLSTSAVARNNSRLASSVVTTNASNESSSLMTFAASGMAALGSIVPYNSAVPTLGTGSLNYASETLRSRPSLRGNFSTQESIQGTGSRPLASSIIISSTIIASLSSPKSNSSTQSTKGTDLVPSVPSLTLSHNTAGLPNSTLTLSRTPFAVSINLSSKYSQYPSPSTTSSFSSALIVNSVSNTSSATQHSQASPGSTGQDPSFTTTASTSQSSTAITTPSSLNAYATISSLLTLVTPTVETLPIVETEANGFRTTVTASVTIGAGGVVIPPPIVPIGLFPGSGVEGGSGPNGDPGDEPPEPQGSRSQTLNTQPSTTETLNPPSSSTLTSNTQPSSTISSSTLFLSTLTSSTLSRSSLTLSTLASSAQISTASCSSCDVCPTFDYNPTATPNALDNVDDVMKRELGGRFYNAKRAGSGNEVVTTLVAGRTCAVSRYTQKPAYPGPASVANNEPPATPAPNMAAFYATATYWAVPTQPPQGSCAAPSWTFFDTQQIASYQVNGRPAPWALGGSKKSVNVSCNAIVEFTIMDTDI